MSPVGSSVPQAFSALAVFRDRLIKDLMDRFELGPYTKRGLPRLPQLLPSLPPPIRQCRVLPPRNTSSRHKSPFQQGVLITWVCILLEFGIIILDHCSQQTFGHSTSITRSSIHQEGAKSQSTWERPAGPDQLGRFRITDLRVETAFFGGEFVQAHCLTHRHWERHHFPSKRWTPYPCQSIQSRPFHWRMCLPPNLRSAGWSATFDIRRRVNRTHFRHRQLCSPASSSSRSVSGSYRRKE